MWAAIVAAIQAVPTIASGIASIVTAIANLIEEIRINNQMKKIDLEMREMQKSGNTSKLEERFRRGQW
jgi:hypothetical protein